MKRAAIYTRVSRDEQAQNFSLPTQRAACERYATQHDLRVVTTLEDDETGATLERVGLTKLRELARTRQIEAVILYSTDRFHRNLINQLTIRREIQGYGCEIHYVRRGQLKDTPEDRFVDNMDALVAEYERERIRERTMRGTEGKVKAGLVPGGGLPKYGYRYEGERRERHLVIDDVQAAIVLEVHTRFDRGESVAALQRDLSARKVQTWSDAHRQVPNRRRALGEWDQSAIYGILRDEAYTGRYMAFRHIVRDEKQVHRDARHWLPVACPQIVPRDMWERNQQRLDAGMRLSPRNTRRFYLLRGVVRCGLCGGAMVGATMVRPSGRENRYYKCVNNSGKAVDRCRARYAPGQRLDDAVWLELVAMFERDAMEAALERMNAAPPPTTDDAMRRATLETERASIEAERDRYVLLFGRGSLTLEQFDAKIAGLDRRADAVRAEIDALADAPRPADTTLLRRALADYDLLRDGLLEASEDEAERRWFVEYTPMTVTVTPLDSGQWRASITSPLTATPRECII